MIKLPEFINKEGQLVNDLIYNRILIVNSIDRLRNNNTGYLSETFQFKGIFRFGHYYYEINLESNSLDGLANLIIEYIANILKDRQHSLTQ